ncbi:cAMP-dependent protein kinase catalytic subunit beta-like [Helicoverpa zea]|uniref:cAMP-dependent protein kinase catalytic subunit beta-like n=1 Tax=Helicoverpa zea TaxID=7113 RepID=UPI001F570B51|nr:cAMP-dependent protein kinase catalytic subunit beta-like [Helicoverpa zea]
MKVENAAYESYDHAQQTAHLKTLDLLKHEFMQRVESPPITYEKSLQSFDNIKTIGTGAFSLVFLVRDTTSFTYHAMKAIDKEEVIRKKWLKQLSMEKKILLSVHFPFVTTMDYCLKDNVYVYFILPYMVGGELFTMLRKYGCLSEESSKFYAAQVVLALEYLHHCGVIHRDIKPENIVIGITGYIMLADMGFSKIIKTRTWTICGTPEYLAPEIITSKGYSFAVDWWSLGVLIFEMCAGYPPFFSADPMVLYEKVLRGHFKTPASMSSGCKSLVKHLLEVEPTKRMGALKAGVFDIKSDFWFVDINWNMILHQKVVPPFVPKNGAGDTSNFRDLPEQKVKVSPVCLYEKEFENF